MEIYLSILFVLLVMGVFGATNRRINNCIFVLSCFMLFIFAAMRAIVVGADTRQYEWVFNWVHSLSFSELGTARATSWYSHNQPWGYLFYNKLLSLLFLNAHAITVVNSALVIVAMALLVKRYSPDRWLSVYLFFTLGLYQLSLNLTPSMISLFFMSAMISLAEKRKWIPYFGFLIILTIFIHTSAIAFIPIFFLTSRRITGKTFSIIALTTAGLSLLYERLIPIFEMVLPVSYHPYLFVKSGVFEQLAVWGTHFCLIAICWLSYPDKKVFWERNQIGMWFFLFESIFYFFAIQNGSFARAAFLFSGFMIVTVPRMLSFIATSMPRENIESKYLASTNFVKKSRNYYAICVAFSTIAYLIRISVNNIGTTMPYKFFFDL